MNYNIEVKHENHPLKHFLEISKIPRGSGKEKAASDFLVQFASDLGLWVYKDEALNVYVKKDGIGNGKNKEPILFQGHIDMVWEKNADTDFNFETDPLNLYVEDGWLKARGTTLGADNGVAIAYMMSFLADTTSDSPPIECLFTSEEETGLFGAVATDMTHFDATKFINLDCGPEGYFMTSSAGGVRTNFHANLKREKLDDSYKAFNINILGLKGGHSGSEIALELGNSLKIGARMLYELSLHLSVVLADFKGGDMDNAIPREAFIKTYVNDVEKAGKLLKKIFDEISFELAETEPDFHIDVNFDETTTPISKVESNKIIKFLYLTPNGPFHKNLKLNDLVINSNNLAVVKTSDEEINISTLIRSSIESLKQDLMNQLELLATDNGLSFSHTANYPGWAYEKDSPLREELVIAYKEQTGKDAVLEAIHAGLECGIFKDKKPSLDIVAIGPNSLGAHTPQERLELASFDRVYEFLKLFLKNAANAN